MWWRRRWRRGSTWWWGARLVGLGPCVPVPLVEFLLLGVALSFPPEVSDLARFAERFEGADVLVCGPVESDDVFITCLVIGGAEFVEFYVEECFPYAVSDGGEPFRPGSAYSFCKDGDSSTVFVDAG